ncbi:hypothetical protein SARC_05112 [Sphaeroforma arctica JP610]|uniref:Ethanolamine-phosphate phospho-lyase n=1 Tax=Sphaeroforma arctica JP610 TaxID=667725 RepID=A0A0L0G0N5_9EUKA|nr:hypothetical protein SARC_05112 [Sphaeroforma arctica JP610]KNC82615.1 hypothetical protein SARC_05112 [Sphaeroforma arctica JP610]|eukprot:XP_014156517.1 hypothetical protein SARC_05112 [Sphaeroforma arctica JP610]
MKASSKQHRFKPFRDTKPHSPEVLEAVGFYIARKNAELAHESTDTSILDSAHNQEEYIDIGNIGDTTEREPNCGPGCSSEILHDHDLLNAHECLSTCAEKFNGLKRSLIVSICSLLQDGDVHLLPQAAVLGGLGSSVLLVHVPRHVDAYEMDVHMPQNTEELGSHTTTHTGQTTDAANKDTLTHAKSNAITNNKQFSNALGVQSKCEEVEVKVSSRFVANVQRTLGVTPLVNVAAQAMRNKNDPIKAAACIVGAYNSVIPLGNAELRMLFPLMCARLCLEAVAEDSAEGLHTGDSVVPDICEVSGAAKDGTRQFTDTAQSSIPALDDSTWDTLRILSHIPPAMAYYRLRHACGFTPVLQSDLVADWLRTHSEELAPVLHPMNTHREALWTDTHVFDLSVGSPLVAGHANACALATAMREEMLGTQAQQKVDNNTQRCRSKSKGPSNCGTRGDSPGHSADHCEQKAEYSGISECEGEGGWMGVGVGRYNEARLLSTSNINTSVYEEMPEQRTIALGIDLFPLCSLGVETSTLGSKYSSVLEDTQTCTGIGTVVYVYAPLEGTVDSVSRSGERGYTVVLKHTVGKELTFYTLYGKLSFESESCNAVVVGATIAKGERLACISTAPYMTGATDTATTSHTNNEEHCLPPSLHFQLITDITCVHECAEPCSSADGEYSGSVDQNSQVITVCSPSERAVMLSICPDPNLILGIPAHFFPPPMESKDSLLASRRAHVGRNLSVSYGDENALHIARASQQFLYDVDGRAYLDLVNNVCHVGHANPRVVRAATRQMAVLNTNTRYVYDNLTRYAEKLTATLPETLSVCFFVNSGSEANDLALRMAREHTGMRDVIALGAGYHGNLSSLIDISAYKHEGPGGKGPGDSAHVALMPDPYRGKYRGMGRDTGEKYASHVKDILDGYTKPCDSDTDDRVHSDMHSSADAEEKCPAHTDTTDSHTGQPGDVSGVRATRTSTHTPYTDTDTPHTGTAHRALVRRGVGAFIAESVLGCGGQVVLCDGYLQSAYKHVRANGGVCIADEVQVGFGRVGCKFWGFETQNVVPDIVTMGKPIGNGHPLGAVVTTRAIAESFDNKMEYFNTFGGNPVSCAVGLAVLNEIHTNQLQAHAQELGERLLKGLKDLQTRHPLIGDVRGLGLFVGVELVLNRDSYHPIPADKHASHVAKRVRDFGVLISIDGPDHNVLKMKPPLVVTAQDLDRLVSVLDRVLGEDALQL